MSVARQRLEIVCCSRHILPNTDNYELWTDIIPHYNTHCFLLEPFEFEPCSNIVKPKNML